MPKKGPEKSRDTLPLKEIRHLLRSSPIFPNGCHSVYKVARGLTPSVCFQVVSDGVLTKDAVDRLHISF
jgi:hypothetical protein